MGKTHTTKSKSDWLLVLYSYLSEFMQMVTALILVLLVQLAQVSCPTERKLSESQTSFLEYLLCVRIPK